MMRQGQTRISTLVFLIVVLLSGSLSAGCEEAVAPVLGTDQAFTLFGFFNPESDSQAVRIFPIDGQLEKESADPLEAAVRSIDLSTGEIVSWQNRVLRFPSGDYGHVAYAPFRAEYEHRYRLEVAAPDGRTTSVETTVPPRTEPEIADADPANFELLIPVVWKNAPNLIGIEVRYVSNVGTRVVDYGVEQQIVGDGRQVTIRFRADTRFLFSLARTLGLEDVILEYMELRVVVTNKEWIPPGGVFDPDVLVQPGTFSNVVDGFGFVGAGYEATVRWRPSDAALLSTGIQPGDWTPEDDR